MDRRLQRARRRAFYTKLGPGRYDFEVQATHDDVAWSATPAALAYPSAADRPVLSKLQRGAREILGTAD